MGCEFIEVEVSEMDINDVKRIAVIGAGNMGHQSPGLWRRAPDGGVPPDGPHGHPLGATGIRLLGTLARILRAKGGRYGLATACVGGGQGVATIIERE